MGQTEFLLQTSFAHACSGLNQFITFIMSEVHGIPVCGGGGGNNESHWKGR
jgi:hypothetical protein